MRESPGIDPSLTLFLNRADDTMPTREFAFGRRSRVAPIDEDLEAMGLNPNHYATNPGMYENPHPGAQRPDTNFLELGFTSATTFEQVEADNTVTIDIGSAFEQLSDAAVTPAFKQHMMSFRWRLDLQDFRTEYQYWDRLNSNGQEQAAGAETLVP
jgi:hypothetical protein